MSFQFRPAAVGLLAGALAASCSSCSSSSPAPPVPVAGSDLGQLAGRWEGQYSSEATGRTGSIVFELKSGEKVARGDVLMVPKGAQDPKVIPQMLNINFVNAACGVLRGTMDPYTDPACACEVQTTFVGRQSGDTIEGTFTTTPSGNLPITTGRWKITRQKK
jgi:hypothetical protein